MSLSRHYLENPPDILYGENVHPSKPGKGRGFRG
jgi:hypothetical protein